MSGLTEYGRMWLCPPEGATTVPNPPPLSPSTVQAITETFISTFKTIVKPFSSACRKHCSQIAPEVWKTVNPSPKCSHTRLLICLHLDKLLMLHVLLILSLFICFVINNSQPQPTDRQPRRADIDRPSLTNVHKEFCGVFFFLFRKLQSEAAAETFGQRQRW